MINSQTSSHALDLLEKLETLYPRNFGLYFKDLSSGESLSWRADEIWYLASGVKLLIAFEVFRQIDEQQLSENTTLVVRPEDWVDGPGLTLQQPVGSTVSVGWLLEQMIEVSDNFASDLLIRQIGFEKFQSLPKKLNLKSFGLLTRLSDVRRLAFSKLFPQAHRLTGQDLLEIKLEPTPSQKIRRLQILLGIDTPAKTSWDDAFEQYYAQGYNSSTLTDYGLFLEKVFQGPPLSSTSQNRLLQLMLKCQTGTQRLKAGLPAQVLWAHKTGTQHRRVGDFGLLLDRVVKPRRACVIVACARGLSTLEDGEDVLRRVARLLTKSGVVSGFATDAPRSTL